MKVFLRKMQLVANSIGRAGALKSTLKVLSSEPACFSGRTSVGALSSIGRARVLLLH